MAGSRRNRTTTKRTSNTRGSNTSLSTIQKKKEQEKKETNNTRNLTANAQRRNNNNQNRTNIGNPRRQTGVQQQVQQKKKETTNRFGQLTKGNLQTIAGQHETTFNAIRNPMEQQYMAAEEIRKQRGEKTPENLGLYEQLLNKERSGMKETREQNLEKAAKKIKKGEKNIEKSTEELGRVGKFAADLYGAGLGMASDALAGPAATVSLLSRSFGGAYNRAKEEGADDSQAALYGAASGGMEALSEKMFAVATPLRKLYGAGAGDALTKKVMDKLESKASSYVGKNIASRGINVFGSAVTEALEEMVVEGLDPFVANEIYAEAVGQPREFSWKDVGRAGILGGAMGGLAGGAGNIVDYRQNSKQGARVQEVFGKDGVLELARETADSDESLGKNLTGEALAEMISNGESIVAGQANDIYKTVQQQRQKDEQRNQDSRAAADNIIQKNNYVEPSVIDPQTGEELLRRNTAKKLEEVKAETINMSADMQLPDMTVDRISDSVARIMTGTARTADVNLFTLSNPAAREVYARMTGKELPNTNEATRDELWNQIAQNRVETAAAETLDVADRTKGIIEQRMGDTYEASGQALFAKELAGIDQNDTASLEATVVAFDDFYRAGRRNLSMDDVMAMGNPFHVRAPKELREAAYNAGQQDRFRASDTAKGMQMTLGQTAKESRSMGRKTGSKGKLITDGLSEEMRQELPATQMALLRTLARTFNINIHVVDTLAQQEDEASPNGFYVDGEVYLSMTGDRPLPYIFAHEITHHMQVYAPMEYNQLKELVRSRWGERGDMDAAIDAKRAHYAQHDVSLSYEDALDEIIADSTYEMLQDEGFVDELCRSHRNIAQVLLDAIKNVISKIRATLAEGELFTPAQNANLLSELDILKDFERIWANGLMRAAENRESVGTVSGTESVVKHQLNTNFATEVDSWYNNPVEFNKKGGFFKVGTTSEALKSIGVKDYDITWDKSKIAKILEEHEEMTIDVIKDVPNVIEKPIIVMQSKTRLNSITLLGEVYANDMPVLVALQLNPTSKKGKVLDFAKVASAYGKNNIQNLIDSSDILYVEPNKKRTDDWLSAIRLQLPVGLTNYGSIGRVTYYDSSVNNGNNGPTAMELAMQKAKQDGKVRHSLPDTEYLSAVEKGDMKKAQDMVQKAAAKAMPNTAAKDENGLPREMYHGTSEKFNTFTMPEHEGAYGRGVYFTDVVSEAADYAIEALGIEEDDGIYVWNGEEYDRGELEDALLEEGYIKSAYVDVTADQIVKSKYGDGEVAVVTDIKKIKSSEPVTYDDNGNIIPLSERFNSQNDDIRYSLPDTDSTGRKLTEGQQNFFKNSQMRNEEGKLIPMYHGTSAAGFTVFNVKFTDDERSFFFTSSPAVAKTYSGTSDIFKPNYEPSIEAVNEYIHEFDSSIDAVEQEDGYYLNDDGKLVFMTSELSELFDAAEEYIGGGGIGAANYEVYLNLKNPLIIESGSDNWDHILIPKEIQEDMWEYLGERIASTNTRTYSEYAQERGHDGVIFKNITDSGLYATSYEKFEPTTVAVAFDSEQIKDVNNLNPTQDKDIRYSLQDSEGRELSKGQQKYFRNSKARDEDGNLQVVYHGTPAGEFYIFDKAKGSVEGDFGSGFYFSDSEDDMSANYEGGGPDFDNKIARLAERIEDEEEIDYEEAKEKAREQLYVGDNRFEVYLNIENPAIVGETILLDEDSLDPGYDPEDFDSEEEYQEQIDQDIYDKIDEIIWEVDRYTDVYNADGISEVLWDAVYSGGIGVQELKEKINELYLESDSGELMGNEVTRQIIESLGYDGIIDPTVSTKWNMDIPTGTTHYIVFNPNQIKYVDNLNPTEDPDIRYSLPDEDDVYDYINSNETEFVDFPPVKDYDRVATEVKNKSVEELRNQVEILKRDKRLTHDKVLDKASVKSEMNNLVRTLMTHSEGTTKKTDSKLVDTAVKNASIIYRAFKEGDVASAASTAYYAAEHIVENLQLIDDTAFHNYKALRDTMRTTAVTISEEDKTSIPDFKDSRKRNMGRLRIVNEGGIPVDTLYQELCEVYPELFDQEVTHPADQLMAMADVREALEPYDIMLSAEETEQLVKEAAHDLLEISVKGKPWKSWADRQKEVYDSKLKTMKAMHKEALNDLRIKERMRATRMVNAEKLKAKEYKEKQRDGKARAKANASIMKNYKWLADRLVKPTDDKHIPDGFRKSLADMLQVFDLQSARSKALEEKYGKPSQKTIKMWELRARLSEIAKEDDTGIFEYDGYVFDLMEALANRIDGLTLDQASTEDLASIDTLLKAIVTNIRNYNKAFSDDIKATISGLAEKTIEADNERIAKRGKKADRSGILGGADKILNESMVTPRDFFEQLGGGIEDCFLAMRKGFDKHVDNITKTRAFFDKIFSPYNKKTKFRKRAKPGSIIESWRDGTMMQEFALESGESIKLNPAQMMSLYCLMKREQAQGHIFGSGIVASRVDNASKIKQALGAKIETQGSAVMITLADAEKIISSLTQEQVDMADQLQDYLNNECAEWGNEVSIKLYGYSKFTEKNYFPIKSADQYLDSNFEGRQAAERIKNFGFTKGTVVNANNPIMIDDIFRVVGDHINKMSLYNAFAAPISDFTRVYNYKGRSDNGVITGSVKSSLEDAYGKKAIEYINNFMADVNNTTQTRTEGVVRFIDKSLANYKKATIAGNIRVALQQPTAVMRAFMVMSPKWFVNSNVNVKKNLQDMKEHCQIARWKSWGHNQVDMARDIDDIMMNKEWQYLDALTMAPYGALDNITWSTIWAAVRKETASLHPEVKIDSEEFYALCNDRASEVFDKTQVVDSVFHRSQVMRNKDSMSKMVTSFMAEPTRTFNMLRTEFVEAREMWNEGDKSKAVKLANKTLSIFIINAAAVSAAAAVADALRGKDADGDGEEDDWLENFLANFWGNVNPANMIPVVSDIWGFTDGWGSSNMALEGYEALVKSIMSIPDADNKGEAIRKLAESMGMVFGIPVKNVLREIETAFKFFGIDVFAAEAGEESATEKETLLEKLDLKDGGVFDGVLNKFGFNRTEEEKLAASFDKRVKQYERSTRKMTGKEKDEYLWSEITEGYTTAIEDGDFSSLADMRAMLKAAGGDVEKFDKSVISKVQTALKKSINDDVYMTYEYKNFLMEQYDLTEGKINQDMIMKSDTAKNFQIACCTNDQANMLLAMSDLYAAGLTTGDIETLYTTRASAIKGRNFSTGEFAYPATGEITSGFGYRDEPIAGVGNNHTGLDIAVAENTDIAAADGGKVIYAGYKSGLGNHVKIDHGNGRVSIYGHLNGYYVQKGDAVTKGQTIGLSGSTGMSTGPHLHFGVTENGQYVDPMNYFR